MKKFFVLLIAMLLLLLPLSSCHGSRGLPQFEMPNDFDESQHIEITFWAKNDTNKTQVTIYQNAISNFENLYPNIHVNLRLYTDYSKIYNDVITNISTNTTPNVCITYPDHIATYITGQNVVVPLDELMNDTNYGFNGSKLHYVSPARDEIVEKFLSEGYIGDSCYAIPFMRSTEACYINKTYVEKLGYHLPKVLSWDFIWEVSEAAMKTDADGNFFVNGQKVMIPFIYKSTDNMMIQALYQKGADYSTDEGNILLFNDVTKDFLYTIADHAKSRSFSTFKVSSYPANFLNAGQCIFAIDSTAGATWMGSDAPLLDIAEEQVVEFETVVLPIPQFDADNLMMISQGPSICIFNKTNQQEVLASWIFAQYLLTDDVQTAYAETEGYVPVTVMAQNSEEYQDYLSKEGIDNSEHYDIKIKASKLLMNNTENTFVTPVFNGSTSLRQAAGQLIENVVKSARRNETIDDNYMDELYKDVTALYRLDQNQGSVNEKEDFGPLPNESKTLIITLIVIWVILGLSYVCYQRKNKE